MLKSIYLSIQYMKKQKGRTFALTTGIALAVTLVFSLNVIPETKNMMDIKKAYDVFEDYHVEYNNLDKETIEILKEDKEISQLTNIVNLGTIVNKDGISISLNSYSEQFNEEFGYTLVKGNVPKNSNEIVLEEKALESMGLEQNIGQNIQFNIEKEYIDKNNLNQIFTTSKSFKLVGIIKKPNDYYSEYPNYQLKGFINYKEGSSFIPNELISYNGLLSLNTKNPDFNKIQQIMYKYDINKFNFVPNMQLIEALEDYQMSKETKFNRNNKLLPMFASVLLIYNVFNMILTDMIKQIGTLRAIGASKKHIRLIIGFQSLTVLIAGILLGIILGITSSYIGLLGIYKTNVELYFSKISFLEPILMAGITVVLASIIPIYKSGKISPVEAIRTIDRSSTNQKNRLHHKVIKRIFGITGEMAYKNVWRNKFTTIFSILSISIGGALYIEKMASYNMEGQIESTTLDIMSMGDVDINLTHNKTKTDENLVGYNDEDINELYAIKDIKTINPNMTLNGFFKVQPKQLSDEYIDSENIDTESDITERNLSMKGLNETHLKQVEKYIKEGSLPSNEQGYINAVVYNNFYYMKEHDNDNKILKTLNIGDLITIKMPVVEDNVKRYEEHTIKVSGILSRDWGKDNPGGYDKKLQIILNEDDFKEITNINLYNNIYIQIEKDSDVEVHRELEKNLRQEPLTEIESKYNYKLYYLNQDKKLRKEVLIVVALISMISSINIFCTIKTNLLIRTKELSTLRSIGMSMRELKKMIIKESLIYGITSTTIAGIIGTYEHYKYIAMTNKIFNNGLGTNQVIQFNIPVTEIIQYGVICILVCLIAVILSKRKIERLSISEGLRIDN